MASVLPNINAADGFYKYEATRNGPMKYPIRAPNNTLIPMRLPYGSVIFILTAYNEIDGRSLESKGFPQLIFK